jgi:hypothetical protein
VSEAKKTKKARRPRSSGPRVDGGTRDARRVAALILEVLAGQRTPVDAARELGVSVTRYYGLEAQGLEALVEACEPKRRGPRVSAQTQIAKLEKKVAQLEKECARRQSLLRLSQRALGLGKPSEPERTPGKRGPKRPVVRALKVATQLDTAVPVSDPIASTS